MRKDNKTVSLLLQALREGGIRYVVWKNTHEIDEAIKCNEDLDLLINRHQFSTFNEIMNTLGFRQGLAVISSYPDIFHFYRYDSQTGKLLHLHVYTRLMTGESHIKNYHLPVEQILLDGSEEGACGFRISSLDRQRVLFIIRHYIKVSCLPGSLLLLKQKPAVIKEFDLLCSGEAVGLTSNEQSLLAVLSIPEQCYIRMLGAFSNADVTITKILMGLRLRWMLRCRRRGSVIANWSRRYWQILVRALNKVFLKTKKTPLSGGVIVAITGSDGAGKTTLANELAQWLNSHFTVRRCHMGRPPPTLLTAAFRLLKNAYKRYRHSGSASGSGEKSIKLINAINYVVIAYERSVLAKKMESLRNRGFIIISDRYAGMTTGVMDSPRIGVKQTQSDVIKYLGSLEEAFYRRMPKADLALELEVSLDNAIARNQKRDKKDKESDEEIKKRFVEKQHTEYIAEQQVTLDADQPFTAVLGRAKEVIWSWI